MVSKPRFESLKHELKPESDGCVGGLEPAFGGAGAVLTSLIVSSYSRLLLEDERRRRCGRRDKQVLQSGQREPASFGHRQEIVGPGARHGPCHGGRR
ncbi:hypothetical protein V5799_005137 [Amblyomma americanum]|uniref:Uncharacterized protein n=1 Tax=Amblyomma americanum TaxID=6943 RepID=A0AAQ4E041_AMBAM